MREAPNVTAMAAAQSRPVRAVAGGSDVRARRERIGLKIYELADEAGVHKDTLADWERGRRNPNPDTVQAVLAALDRIEEEMGIDEPVPPPATKAAPGMVRFEVTGVYGADALVVEGPVESIAELEAAIDRIMRGSQRRNDGAED